MKVLLLFSTSQLLAQNTIDGRISKAEEKCAVFLDKVVCASTVNVYRFVFRRWSVFRPKSKYPSISIASPKL